MALINKSITFKMIFPNDIKINLSLHYRLKKSSDKQLYMTAITYVVRIGIVKGIHYRRVLLPSAIGQKHIV